MNEQINEELCAYYTYMAMAAWCAREDVALPGMAAFFTASSREENQHALFMMDYQAKRGGRVTFQPIRLAKGSESGEWKSAKACLQTALSLEKQVFASLLKVHQAAEKHGDPQLCDFIAARFLQEQVISCKELADLVTQCKRVGDDGLGLYLFDQEMSKLAAVKASTPCASGCGAPEPSAANNEDDE